MKLRRYLVATAVPVAIAAGCAGSALAAGSKVTFRVEGLTHTLSATRTVTAPSTGSVTKGGTPPGVCPADSAAGALGAATHGDWNGTYSSGLGIEVTDILGTDALYAHGSYWEFFVNDRAASEGVCDTKLTAGDQLLFAQVPAKGRAELPIVVSAPTTVTAGTPIDVRTFVYPGRGNATKPVRASLSESFFSYSKRSRKIVTRRIASGVTRLTFDTPGTYAVNATAKGDIRSATSTVKVTG